MWRCDRVEVYKADSTRNERREGGMNTSHLTRFFFFFFFQVRGCFVLTPKVLTKAKERMIVLHPLPRIDEIRYIVHTHTHTHNVIHSILIKLMYLEYSEYSGTLDQAAPAHFLAALYVVSHTCIHVIHTHTHTHTHLGIHTPH